MERPPVEVAPADSPPPPEVRTYSTPTRAAANLGVRSESLNAAQVIQRYAAGTVLQAGPGIPAWSYNSYGYFWDGPVEISPTRCDSSTWARR